MTYQGIDIEQFIVGIKATMAVGIPMLDIFTGECTEQKIGKAAYVLPEMLRTNTLDTL
jgi:hypothetical protein